MRRELVTVVAVVVLGYALYGGMAVAGMMIDDAHSPSVDSPANVSESPDSPFWFQRADVGFDYEYAESFRGNDEMISNAGVYVTDFNGDGWPDLLAIGGTDPVLYENLGGRFEPAGVLPSIEPTIRSALVLDYDADGREDLLLLPGGSEPILLRNVGGRYERVDAGFDRSLEVPIGAAAGDFDGDGCTDLYVAQYGNWSEKRPRGLRNYSVAFEQDNGYPNYFYEGNCETFERSTSDEPTTGRWTLASTAVDLTGDGSLDVYVANDFNHDLVLINDGNGNFERRQLGNRTNRNGMSTEIADVSGNGQPDVFVTNIHFPDWVDARMDAVMQLRADGNNLLVNEENGTFSERAERYNVSAGGWGWAAVAADFDADGDEDLFHTTRTFSFERRDVGFSRGEQAKLSNRHVYSFPAFWARSNETFEKLYSPAVGFESHDGRGAATLDFDRDGDPDLAVATTDSFALYENVNSPGRAIQVVVEDENGLLATGTEVTARTDDGTQRQWVRRRTDFLAQDTDVATFGVGGNHHATIRVEWPDGTVRTIEGVDTGQRIVVRPSGIIERTQFEKPGA